MSTHFADDDRQKRIALLVILGIGSIMLWQTAFGNLLLYPFTILTTWFHEMGHGIAAILMGERFEQLEIYADGSGVALSQVSTDRNVLQDAIIAAGGPIGPALAGAALIASSRTPRGTQVALAVLQEHAQAALVLGRDDEYVEVAVEVGGGGDHGEPGVPQERASRVRRARKVGRLWDLSPPEPPPGPPGPRAGRSRTADRRSPSPLRVRERLLPHRKNRNGNGAPFRRTGPRRTC